MIGYVVIEVNNDSYLMIIFFQILQVVNASPDLPNMSKSTLRLILKHLNFKYASRKRRSCLIDRADIREWRKKYLLKIKQYRREGRTIYYQDETWLNEGE